MNNITLSYLWNTPIHTIQDFKKLDYIRINTQIILCPLYCIKVELCQVKM